jgi:chromosome segregation ATPase
MTTAKPRKEQMSELKDAIEEIDVELEGALEELREVRERIANLREDRKWRVEAIRFLKAGG